MGKNAVRPKSRRQWPKAVLLLAGGVVGLYIVWMAAYYVTSEPRFCAACHLMKPYVASWKTYPHRSVKCLYCHEFRGFVGKLESKTRGSNDVYLYLTEQWTEPVQAKIFDENCIACHLGDNAHYPTPARLNKRHETYIRQDRTCVPCHRATGHRVNLFSGAKYAGD